MKLRKLLGMATLATTLAGPAALQAQSVEEFYSGKTVNLYIGYSVGGGYDTYARLLAAHIGKHIPGNPDVVPINMPGAGSLRLMNWLAEAAPKDGTAFGAVARAVPFEPLLGNEAASFDAKEMNYIGNINAETSLCAVNADTGITSVDQMKEQEVMMGGTGAASDPNQQSNILNEALGTKMRIIDGYPGGNDIVLAMERGEVSGRCGWSWSTIQATRADWVTDGTVNLLLQIARKPHPDLPDVPLASDLAETPQAKSLISFIVAPQEMGRPYVAPPGVPEDRVKALRDAFDATMEDPDFLAAAKETGVSITPSTGAELKEIVEEVYAADPETVERVIQIVR